MGWIGNLVERITHRHILETQIEQLRQELRLANEKLQNQQIDYEECKEKLDCANQSLCNLNAWIQNQESDTRLATVEEDRTELFHRVDELNVQLQELQESAERDSRLTTIEQDRTELFRRVDDLRQQIGKLQENTAENARLATVEQDRTELFHRIDELRQQIGKLQENAEENTRLITVEQDRTELFHRVDDLSRQIGKLQQNAEENTRLITIEQDRTELFQRVDTLNEQVFQLQQDMQGNERIDVLERDRTELFLRFDALKERMRKCGILNLNTRFDSRITRLEILDYYSDGEKYAKLDQEQKKLIDQLKSDYDYERKGGRTYPEDPYYEGKSDSSLPFPVREEDGLWCADVDGKKIFCIYSARPGQFVRNHKLAGSHFAYRHAREAIARGTLPHRCIYQKST